MKLWASIKRPPWRTLIPGLILLICVPLGYALWSPGQVVKDGRHDLGRNGIWIQHGWLGDDGWFERNQKTDRKGEFRSAEQIKRLARLLREHHITDIFPHLCPVEGQTGRLPAVDSQQTKAFLREFEGFRVMPWIGGVWQSNVHAGDDAWRASFVSSVSELLRTYPSLSGVHLNVEPMPSGNADFLKLLEELKKALPPGRILSVAAYPPPTRWHAFPDVHWQETYFRQVAARSDQIAVMMYDTALRWRKPYQKLMADWTEEVLAWSPGKEVLLGVPVYDDADSGYHVPTVENLSNALLGIHAGLSRRSAALKNYQGIAIYCEWEMDQDEWRSLRQDFLVTDGTKQ